VSINARADSPAGGAVNGRRPKNTVEIPQIESAAYPNVRPWVRVTILSVFLVAACFVSYIVTGSIVPIDSRDALIFQNALLFIVLGSAVVEHKFTKPADSVVNSLMGLVTLVTVYRAAHGLVDTMSLLLDCLFPLDILRSR